MLSSAPHPARETIGGCGAVDGWAVGRVGAALDVGLAGVVVVVVAVGTGSLVVGSAVAGAVAVSVVAVAGLVVSEDVVATGDVVAGSVGVVVSVGVGSCTNTTGATCGDVAVTGRPGSTRARRRPAGSEAAARLPSIRSCTPSEGPTHSGA